MGLGAAIFAKKLIKIPKIDLVKVQTRGGTGLGID